MRNKTKIFLIINLKKLNCFGNSISALNLQGLTSLEYINAAHNAITTININGLIALQELSIYNNLLLFDPM